MAPSARLTPRSSLALLVPALLSLAAAGPARAQDTPQRVYIVSVPTDPTVEAEAARVGAAARATLRGLPGVDWEGADQRFLGYMPSTLQRLDSARQHLPTAGRPT